MLSDFWDSDSMRIRFPVVYGITRDGIAVKQNAVMSHDELNLENRES